MIKSNGVEHFDNFGDSIIFWCIVDNVPQKYINKAKEIDKENYSSDCFGCCIILDTDGWAICQDEPNCELYYIDNNGDKHWVNKTFTDKEKETFIDDCFEIITESIPK